MRRAPVVLALSLVLPMVAVAQPRIALEPEHVDFGDLSQNETRDSVVVIRNDGDQTLIIRDIESTCGCTVPELTVTELAPGASTEMEIHFNSKNFQGKQNKYIHVFSNDPSRGAVDLLITADISVPLHMTPSRSQLGFRTLQVGETQTLSYTFSTENVDELEITPSTWPQAWLDIEVKPGNSPQTVLVDFVVKPDAEPGRHRDSVKLRTNVPEMPLVTLTTDIKLISDLVITPDKVNLRMLRPDQTVKSRVRVSPYRPDTEFEIISAEVDIPGLRVRVENGDQETTIWLDGQSLPADHERVADNGAVRGSITIRTNLASSPQIIIPVMYMVRQ